ncbi:hypothetical protein ES703_71738 [subsurface metagenome]
MPHFIFIDYVPCRTVPSQQPQVEILVDVDPIIPTVIDTKTIARRNYVREPVARTKIVDLLGPIEVMKIIRVWIRPGASPVTFAIVSSGRGPQDTARSRIADQVGKFTRAITRRTIIPAHRCGNDIYLVRILEPRNRLSQIKVGINLGQKYFSVRGNVVNDFRACCTVLISSIDFGVGFPVNKVLDGHRGRQIRSK